MFYPTLTPTDTRRVTITNFGGLNHDPVIGAGEFAAMHNLSADAYPALTVRPQRGLVSRYRGCLAMIWKDGLVWLDDTGALHAGDHTLEYFGNPLDPRPKRLVPMGARVILFPDKNWCNTVALANGTLTEADYGGLEAAYIGTVTAQLQEGQTKLTAPNIDEPFQARDTIHIGDRVTTIRDLGPGWLLVDGDVTDLAGSMSLFRQIPDMDFVVEQGNRLWGCRFAGLTNEIYASCLGDPTNWERFDGLADDAYRASRGADGPFTGAVAYGGGVLFFRQQCLEKVYPNASGAHQIVTTALDGVAPGCDGTLQIVDGTLYYLSSRGVMAYDGALPVNVSPHLRGGVCTGAVAGGWRGRYYLCCATDQGQHVLVYDTRRGLWHREDSALFTGACTSPQELFFLDPQGDVWSARGQSGTKQPLDHWEAVTGPLGLTDPDRQHAGRMELRLELSAGAALTVWAQYDGQSDWVELATVQATPTRRLFSLPIRPRRCHQLRLKLQGTGAGTLYSITRSYETGTERG